MLAKDEARRIGRTLASVPAGARTVVLDAESADATATLARAAGARVVVRPWDGFVRARRFALGLVETEWTFMLDADETLTAALAAELGALGPAADVDAFAVPRTTYLCGAAIRHGPWGGDAPVRLFRTRRATLVARPAAGGDAELHERWTVPGRVERTRGSLDHDSYPTLASYRRKFARYTSLEASGVRTSFGGLVRACAIASLRVPWYLLAKGGWRDGWRGAFVATASAAYPAAVAWKAWRRT